MKIAQVAPIRYTVLPDSGHPVANVIRDITEGLIKKGHEVTLFTVSGSKTSAKLFSVFKESLSEEDISQKEKESGHTFSVVSAWHNLQVYLQADNFDVIHTHLGNFGQIESVFLAPLIKTPTVSTFHCPLNEIAIDILKDNSKNQTFVGISQSQLEDDNFFVKSPVVYHGIDLKKFEFNNKGGNYLFFAARLHPQKGAHIAIKISQRLRMPLKIAGRILSSSQDYFEKEIKPFLKSPNTEYLGEKSSEQMSRIYQNAKAFLFPIQWEEPFGLVMIEAMACGTPIIAYARGSVPEVVVDGKTGFIVNSSDSDKRGNWIVKKTGLEGFEEAVRKIYEMPKAEYQKMRANCRKRIEENFTIEKMVDGYEAVYKKVIRDFKKK